MFKTLYRAAVTAVAGIAELFATVMVALCLTSTGTVEMRINSAISTMVEGLGSFKFPRVLVPAAHEVANFLGRVPQWAIVAFALWGLFRALMAIHGHGAWAALKEAFQEWRAAISVTKVTKKATPKKGPSSEEEPLTALPGAASGTVVTS